jgi:hypothetical protein
MKSRTSYLLAALLLLAVAGGARAEESCVTCHPEVKTEYLGSVHAKEFGCTACHGGDPTVTSLESHSVAKGYIGKPDRTSIPALCAVCHADPKKMEPYGLATDQYAQYQTSEHGQLLAQGDSRVAVCTDCHGTHHILAPEEPISPVSRQNIPATCGHCHSNQELMAPYKVPTDQEQKFRRSVHGVALFVDQHRSAPTCATCHGAHGAVAPQVGSISRVCGHCHARTREYFDQGPHRKAADEGKMSECVSCHGYHDIAQPDRTLFDTTCGTCHAQDTPAFATATKLKTLLSRAQESLDTASADMARVEQHFPTVVRYRARLQQARSFYVEALPVQHSLALDRVDDLTRSARSTAEEVQGAVHGVEQEDQVHYLVLALVWMFILFLLGVAYRYRKERRRDHPSADVGP